MKHLTLILLLASLCFSSYGKDRKKTDGTSGATASKKEWKQGKVTVIIPKESKIGTSFEMKLIYNSKESIILTEDSDIFQILRKSSSSKISNNIITHEDSYTIEAIRDGSYRIDELLFESVPENLHIDPIEFKVNY